MTRPFRPIRLSIVDFLGVFLPGSVWTILILTIVEGIGVDNLTRASSPFSVVLRAGLRIEEGTATPSLGFYLAFLIAALLLGYLVKAISSRPAEVIVNGLAQVSHRLWSKPEIIDRFPFDKEHGSKPYFAELEKLLFRITALKGHSELPDYYQPFEACKCLLKEHAPALWEEVQEREAQVRFLVSLLLAAVTSLVLAVFAVFVVPLLSDVLPPRQSGLDVLWLVSSILWVIVLSWVLWRRRHTEVLQVYLSTLVVARRIWLSGARSPRRWPRHRFS